MKNVLFIGPYRQRDGWGNAAKAYLRTLSRMEDINLISRPVYLSNERNYEDNQEFEKLERTDVSDFDVIIQNTLPELFRYFAGPKNIGLSYFETLNINNTPWCSAIAMMDRMWVCSKKEATMLSYTGVTDKVDVIRMEADIEKYKADYKSISVFMDGKYNFYFIGEYIDRKNLHDLLSVYMTTFKRYDNVRLVLKLNSSMMSGDKLKMAIHDHIEQLKSILGTYRDRNLYPEIAIITDYLSDSALCSLHKSCHCFVTASHGEAFCIPAFDAVAFGNKAIVSDNTSMIEFSPSNIVNCQLSQAIAPDRSVPYLYNGKDYWCDINKMELGIAMTDVFEEGMDKADPHIPSEYMHETVAEAIRRSIDAN